MKPEEIVIPEEALSERIAQLVLERRAGGAQCAEAIQWQKGAKWQKGADLLHELHREFNDGRHAC